VDVVIVELLEDRQIFGGLLGVDQFIVPSLCGSAFAAGGLWFLCRVRGAFLVLLTAQTGPPEAHRKRAAIPPGSGRTETAPRRDELSSPQSHIHPGE
jgi:hypothetical protein